MGDLGNQSCATPRQSPKSLKMRWPGVVNQYSKSPLRDTHQTPPSLLNGSGLGSVPSAWVVPPVSHGIEQIKNTTAESSVVNSRSVQSPQGVAALGALFLGQSGLRHYTPVEN